MHHLPRIFNTLDITSTFDGATNTDDQNFVDHVEAFVNTLGVTKYHTQSEPYIDSIVLFLLDETKVIDR